MTRKKIDPVQVVSLSENNTKHVKQQQFIVWFMTGARST